MNLEIEHQRPRKGLNIDLISAFLIYVPQLQRLLSNRILADQPTRRLTKRADRAARRWCPIVAPVDVVTRVGAGVGDDVGMASVLAVPFLANAPTTPPSSENART